MRKRKFLAPLKLTRNKNLNGLSGTAEPAAEKLGRKPASYQGTALAVPISVYFLSQPALAGDTSASTRFFSSR
jgi:hypothetical protein